MSFLLNGLRKERNAQHNGDINTAAMGPVVAPPAANDGGAPQAAAPKSAVEKVKQFARDSRVVRGVGGVVGHLQNSAHEAADRVRARKEALAAYAGGVAERVSERAGNVATSVHNALEDRDWIAAPEGKRGLTPAEYAVIQKVIDLPKLRADMRMYTRAVGEPDLAWNYTVQIEELCRDILIPQEEKEDGGQKLEVRLTPQEQKEMLEGALVDWFMRDFIGREGVDHNNGLGRLEREQKPIYAKGKAKVPALQEDAKVKPEKRGVKVLKGQEFITFAIGAENAGDPAEKITFSLLEKVLNRAMDGYSQLQFYRENPDQLTALYIPYYLVQEGVYFIEEAEVIVAKLATNEHRSALKEEIRKAKVQREQERQQGQGCRQS